MNHIDRSLRTIVREAQATFSFLHLEEGSRHARLRNTHSGDFIPIPGSSGDWRVIRNFTAAVRRLATLGRGLIFAKSGILPILHP